MWPRLRLTPEESHYNSKYEDPKTKQIPVLRKIYPGFLDITPIIRQDQETFQISRRCRLFGMTVSGDINMFEIQIIDITGEQFTTNFTHLPLLMGGTNFDPRGRESFSVNIAQGIATGFMRSDMNYLSPLIFEPNIVLAPNQTITINGRPVDPNLTDDIHIDICFHVWEFPGMPGSPL